MHAHNLLSSTFHQFKSFEENKERTLTHAKYHANFDTCELLHHLENTENTKKENTLFRERTARLGSLTPGNHFRQSVMNSLTDDIAEELDMDHIYVTFSRVFVDAYIRWSECLLSVDQRLLNVTASSKVVEERMD